MPGAGLSGPEPGGEGVDQARVRPVAHPGDVAIGPDDQYLALYSKKGKLLLIELAEVKQLSGGGRGTILMGLDATDALAQWLAVGPRGLGARGVYRAKETVVVLGPDEFADYIGKRARKGRLLAVKVKQPELVQPDAPAAS